MQVGPLQTTVPTSMTFIPIVSPAPDVGVNGDGGPPPPRPTRVESHGEWDSFTHPANYYPALQSRLPITVVFKKVDQKWQEHLLIAESALLRLAGAKPGFGAYALRDFHGPRERGGALQGGEEIGSLGGTIVAWAPTRNEASAQATALAKRGSAFLVPMLIRGHPGWHVVNGQDNPVLPFLYRVNDPKGTRLTARSILSEFGKLTATRLIKGLDRNKSIMDQASSELSMDYGEKYWDIHSTLGTEAMPIVIDAKWRGD